MTEARQRVMSTIGKDGCYFLSIVRAGERITGQRIDAVALYLKALEHNWMRDDCYVIVPELILGDITGTRWSVAHVGKTYYGMVDEVVILRYEVARTGITYSHFVLAGEDGSIEYDPYGSSRTVQDGQLQSKRVFKRIT